MGQSIKQSDCTEVLTFFPGPREIRILFLENSPIAGVFDDPTAIMNIVNKYGKSPNIKGIFVSLNVVSPHLVTNRLGRDYYISAEDIIQRDHFLIDFDTVSTIEETEKIARKAKEWLKSLGWPDPLFACSGNGFHLVYNMRPTAISNEFYIKNALEAIANRFSTLVIDTKVANAARHARLYGTLNNKEGSRSVSYIIERPQGELSIEKVKELSDTLERPQVEINQQTDSLSLQTLEYLKRGAPAGNRNNTLFMAACNFAKCGYSQEVATARLTPPSQASGLSTYEINRTIYSAYSKDRKSGEYTSPITLHSMWRNFPNHDYFVPEWEVKVIPPYMKPPWQEFAGQTMVGTYSGGKITGAVSLDNKYIGKVSVLGVNLFSGKEEIVKIVSGTQRWLDHMMAGELVLGLVPTSPDSVLVAKTIPLKLVYV